MRRIRKIAILVLLLIPMPGLAVTQERVGEHPPQSRSGAVEASVHALREDVRKLSEDVRELLELLKSRDKQVPAVPVPSDVPASAVDENKTRATLPEPARAIQIGSIEDAKTAFHREISAGDGDQAIELSRSLSLVDAKTIALKAHRASDSTQRNTKDSIEKLEDEQNLLKSVEDNYWELWCAYEVYGVHRKTLNSVLRVWKTAADKESLSAVSQQQIANLTQRKLVDLNVAVNGSKTAPQIRGLYQIEAAFRNALGLSTVRGPMLRPSDTPTRKRSTLGLPTLMEMALNENPHLRQKRIALENFPDRKPKAPFELKELEAMLAHEVRICLQNIESNFVAIKLNLDWTIANEREVEIYSERLRSEEGDHERQMDNLLRAHLRLSQARTAYCQHVGEYNKSLTNAKYLCGQLAVGSE